MHFCRIDVKEGQHVAQGERLGLSGATGRVTGPHLHWAVRWQGAYLDPAKLLKLDLSERGSRVWQSRSKPSDSRQGGKPLSTSCCKCRSFDAVP